MDNRKAVAVALRPFCIAATSPKEAISRVSPIGSALTTAPLVSVLSINPVFPVCSGMQ